MRHRLGVAQPQPDHFHDRSNVFESSIMSIIARCLKFCQVKNQDPVTFELAPIRFLRRIEIIYPFSASLSLTATH
jgi:hypothetical protein